MLAISNLRKHFGGVTAVDGVSLDFPPGSRTGIIGPNGAGKTTLFNLITGEHTPDDGNVELAGTDITGNPPEEVARHGVVRSYQINNLFDELSVKDNIGVVTQRQYADRELLTTHSGSLETEARATEILETVGLEDVADSPASELTHADKRHLEIGIALAADPDVLILDEPTAGMTPAEKTEILALLEKLDDDLAVLLVEHDLEFVGEAVDRVVVLNQGEVIADGSPTEVRDDEQVQQVYIGE